MRQFTDAEKQILQAKIKDEQERRDQAVNEIATRIKEDALTNRVVSRIPTALASFTRTVPVLGSIWKYGFLGVILCLLVFNVIMVLLWRDVSSDQLDRVMYANVVIALMLLFHHVAFHITKRGWASRVMITVSAIWTVFGLAYVIWVFRVF